jgi:hypothetical protein
VSPRRGLQSRTRWTEARQLVDFNGFAAPFHRHRTTGLHGDEPFDEVVRPRRDQHRARARELFHARSEMRCLTDCRVVHVQVIADRAHHDLAGVEPDPDLHGHAVHTPRLLGVPLDRFLHPERGIAGADGVVFVRERRAEQRHDAVAHHLVHRALVAVHSVHHVREDRVEDLTRVLGIAAGEQLHRALQVRKEHCDQLALAFQGTACGEDFLCEIGRGVGKQGWRSSRV